jgi:hypothetical protein
MLVLMVVGALIGEHRAYSENQAQASRRIQGGGEAQSLKTRLVATATKNMCTSPQADGVLL